MDDRPEAPFTGGERVQLAGFLDYLRATVVLKATGLTDEQARRPLVESSPLTTVAGIVSHLTYVENAWFAVVLDGKPSQWAERLAADQDAEFRAGHTTPLPELLAAYEAECARSRDVAERLDLTATGLRHGEPVNLRWVLIHMIEETGRHAGHLDLLREQADGSTGE
ncbi:DinB family protein [Actinophytocola gossypii]|uniref:DinB family protein n=1 Tax=Actinophytocola gossypii TaxID=2812003 RepID=A0ABT2JBJ4_9PSEU|nr:DinB family protein [Actinophytocola gossypii]MCT2585232.1 DinB family protein [Actinophytocola gossypii]